jgi:hypothetical protein
MFDLFSQYYQNTDFETFLADLEEKQIVFMFRDQKTKKILGFSTIYQKKEFIPSAGKARFLFSGDTVMDRSIWGSKCLQIAFFSYIFRTKLLSPFTPVYWMLISKGFKTYMMMRRNFHNSFPAKDKKIPKRIEKAQHYFYKRKFGDLYDHDVNLIKFQTRKDSVKTSYSVVPESQNPQIQFFLERNPGYAQGDELACIAEIKYSDFPKHLAKYIFKPLTQLISRQERYPRAEVKLP